MQFQRILLFIALGLTLMMIWTSWLDFQANYNADGSAEQAESPVTPGGVSLEEVPEAPEVAAGTAPDEPAAPETDVPAGPEDSPGRLIRISTDLINAEIDLRGGDLTRVELKKHPVSVDTPDDPFVLMFKDNSNLFVAQSGLIGSEGEYPNHNVLYSVDQDTYDLAGRESMEVALDWTSPDGIQYQKVFLFRKDSYRIETRFRVVNSGDRPWTGFVYGHLKQTEIDSGGTMGILGALPSFTGAAVYTEADKYNKIDYDEMRSEPLDITTDSGWVAMMQHYFVVAWLPMGSDNYQFYTGVSNGGKPQYRIGYKTLRPVTIQPGESGQLDAVLYAGPKEQIRLDQQGAPGLKLTVDYGWLTPVASPLFWLLQKIHGFTNNWGWAIIFLTVLVKLVFYPLSATSYKSMAKMKKLQPRMATLKERYGDDKQRFQQEMMKMYKEEKVNPAGGCLPILVQIPVFIALYWVLLESVELRQADFMGWLNDLSLPDPYFVLPIIMGASMLIQHFLNPAPVDPIQKKIMLALPFVFTIFFLWFPAGLVLYWVVNNILSIAQQYYNTRKYAGN
ncbi:MAG: membrane protein insertase YidC [Gammaproteobacteria bacterium]|nr:membrane protein insertase YidC [Gammaproteobacteria bacterium]MYD76347.1 membrane protein insertase YidC [Gammaproteobacteria bacterium]MYJ51189.1 membrane protein insertase YidC [Gammaproteobacteria bacterium]